ncbi:MAG: DUF3606 domain-containing protein [Pseudomonadota bacterium]
MPRDSSRIRLEDPQELRYWLNELGTTELRLKIAVKAVGFETAYVRYYLEKKIPD